MTKRVRLWLAILALVLGAAAAVVKTPVAPGHARAKAAIYKPPSGC
jgi:hypothetical protein